MLRDSSLRRLQILWVDIMLNQSSVAESRLYFFTATVGPSCLSFLLRLPVGRRRREDACSLDCTEYIHNPRNCSASTLGLVRSDAFIDQPGTRRESAQQTWVLSSQPGASHLRPCCHPDDVHATVLSLTTFTPGVCAVWPNSHHLKAVLARKPMGGRELSVSDGFQGHPALPAFIALQCIANSK